MDDMDRAQEANEQFQEVALAEQLRFRPTGESLMRCCVCGDDIPEARREAYPGCCKCISCQTEFELMHGRGM